MAFIEMIIELALIAGAIAGCWKVFEKAGKPGWAAIVPIYNLMIMMEIAGKPLWWIVLCMIPFVNIVPMIAFAEKFGKPAGFGVGLALLGFVFFPLLGFGDAQYVGGGAPQGFAPIMPGK
ncbi:MAG TPA: DUF5684 domain-containing protein [Tepidisphaeraceae bacterium]|jgi:hypothetical protein